MSIQTGKAHSSAEVGLLSLLVGVLIIVKMLFRQAKVDYEDFFVVLA